MTRPTNRSVLVDWFAPLDFEVAEAENGDQAITLAKKMHPDLILMDLLMPGANGFQATKAIREIPELSDVVIIAMSASAYNVTREECIKLGLMIFYLKPIDLQKIVILLEKYLHIEWKYEKTAGEVISF